MADPNALQIVWPGLSALLGAAIGGGATLWANNQKHSREREADDAVRKREIKERSFAACVDVLKSGQLFYNEVNGLWYSLYNNGDLKTVSDREKGFDAALRDHFAATAVGRMAVPPTVKTSFDEYLTALRVLSDRVSEWRVDHEKGAGYGLSTDVRTSNDQQCKALQDSMVEKRDIFARIARGLFAEDVWDG